MRFLLGVTVVTLCLTGVSRAGAGFSVQGRRLMRDGLPFQVRGVCYQPTPIGEDPSAGPPHGDYYTAAHAALAARDLPNLRALGANVVRVYAWDPAADHTAFLDACYNGGVDPLFVLVNHWVDPATNWSDAAAVEAIRRQYLKIDAELGTHPAVLGLIIGNETNAHHGNGAKAAYWAAVNSVAASIKQQTPSRLVSVAITDAIPEIAARDATMSALDLWCVQSYRGTTFGALFAQYATASARPLVLTEFGIDAWNQVEGRPYPDDAAFVGTAVAALWSEIAANAEICSGACVFEYADEWWKSGSPSTHDAGGFPASLPDGFANEEWWGLYAVSDQGRAPDLLTARATVDALRSAWMPPTLTVIEAPASRTIAPGGTVTSAVQVQTCGGVPVHFLWLKDGMASRGPMVRRSSSTTSPRWMPAGIQCGSRPGRRWRPRRPRVCWWRSRSRGIW